MDRKPVRITDLRRKKQAGEKITMLTAYDTPTARLLDAAGLDVLLVGDSVGMVMLGHDSTLPVTLDAMVHHTAAVGRGVSRALVVADMPFLSYQVTPPEAIRNAGRLLQEGGAAAVKLEGGRPVADVVQRLVEIGIPVMGHLGLRPQSVHQLGGYARRGTETREADAIIEDAAVLEEAGAFAVVLESIPAALARTITQRLRVPTIGIGAGADCDGQVLVSADMLGLADRVPPFVRQYADLQGTIVAAARAFADDVRSGRFPEATRRPAARRTAAKAQCVLRSPTRQAERSLRVRLDRARAAGAPVGLVPTMGALHAGHTALIERARRDCRCVVVSIFVNPLQFDREDDLRRYPRTLQTDVDTCGALGVDVIFAPRDAEMYPSPPACTVQIARLADHLCGRHRPGHFEGVATVVLKLLQIVQPARAYFGEKDAQQTAIVRRVVRDFNVPVDIVQVPIVREPDGLAISSRNVHLSRDERRVAPSLYRVLCTAQREITAGRTDAGAVRAAAAACLPDAAGLRLEYLEIVDPEDMQPVQAITGPVRIAGAMWVGGTRLIDNLLCVPPDA